MSVPNFMAIHLTFVETFHSEPKLSGKDRGSILKSNGCMKYTEKYNNPTVKAGRDFTDLNDQQLINYIVNSSLGKRLFSTKKSP